MSVVGNLTNATALGYQAVVDASNQIRLGDSNVTVVEINSDVYFETQGFGIIPRDTDGAGWHRITVDTAGTLAVMVVECP